jgi:folylpolyglutamate synthase/dihydropteroate synthase
MLRSVAPGTSTSDVGEALVAARRSAGEAPVVVCGSLYLVGEARALLLDLPTDPPVAL